MKLELNLNPDQRQIAIHKIARTIYAHGGAGSLALAQAFASMILNRAAQDGRSALDVATDAHVFDAWNPDSERNAALDADVESRGMQMCLRVVGRMLAGGIADTCMGATRFHHSDQMPDWAVARGYIADIDGVLFYR